MAGLVALSAGCGRRAAKPTPVKPGGAAAAATSEDDSSAPASTALLDSSLELLRDATPTGESYRLAADRLNQYLEQTVKSGQKLNLDLDKETREALAARLSPDQLRRVERPSFDVTDAMHVGACYLERDLVERLTKDSRDELAKAVTLFEWLVRNVQVVNPDEAAPVVVHPQFVLLRGSGTESERVWVFMELLRQAGLTSALLAVSDTTQKEEVLVPWAVGVVADRRLHLFDVAWGIAIPGPGGQGIATLEEAATDAAVLAQLGLDPKRPYRVRRESLGRVAALIESTPVYWAPRMNALEHRAAGRNRVVVSADVNETARRVTAAARAKVLGPEAWALPLEVEAAFHSNPDYRGQLTTALGPMGMNPGLEHARRLHLRGEFAKAVEAYRIFRDPPAEFTSGSGDLAKLAAAVREDATLFMGHLQLDQGNYSVARDWFGKRYLEKYPKGRWVSTARFNLGLCAEHEGQTKMAIEHYVAAAGSPQASGNLVRARRLGWKSPEGDR